MVEDRRDEHARVGATIGVEVVVSEHVRRVAVVEQHELEPLAVRIVDDLPHVLTPYPRHVAELHSQRAGHRVDCGVDASRLVGRPVHDAQ